MKPDAQPVSIMIDIDARELLRRMAPPKGIGRFLSRLIREEYQRREHPVENRIFDSLRRIEAALDRRSRA